MQERGTTPNDLNIWVVNMLNVSTLPPPSHTHTLMRNLAMYDTMINKIYNRFNSFMNTNTRMFNCQVVYFQFELKRSQDFTWRVVEVLRKNDQKIDIYSSQLQKKR